MFQEVGKWEVSIGLSWLGTGTEAHLAGTKGPGWGVLGGVGADWKSGAIFLRFYHHLQWHRWADKDAQPNPTPLRPCVPTEKTVKFNLTYKYVYLEEH